MPATLASIIAAIPAIVGDSNNTRIGSFTRSIARTLAISCDE